MACTFSAAGSVMTSGGSCTAAWKQFERACGSASFRDKLIKTISALADLARQISDMVNGPKHKSTLQAKKVTELTGVARDVFGLANVFAGALSAIYGRLCAIVAFVRYTAAGSTEDVSLEGEFRSLEAPHSSDTGTSTGTSFKSAFARASMRTVTDRAFTFCELIASLVSQLAYVIAFGAARPVRFAGKVVGNLGKHAQRMVAAFAPVMMVNHVATLVNEWLAIMRIREHTQKVVWGSDGAPSAAHQQYAKRVIKCVCTMAEKTVEFVMDLNKACHVRIAALPMAILGAIAALIGLAGAFFDRYEAPKVR